MALEQFKAWLNGETLESVGPYTRIGPDEFPLLESSELKEAHQLITEHLELLASQEINYGRTKERPTSASKRMLAVDLDQSTEFSLALIEREVAHQIVEGHGMVPSSTHFFSYGELSHLLAQLLSRSRVEKVRSEALLWLASKRNLYYSGEPAAAVLSSFASQPAGEDERELLVTLRGHLTDGDGYGHSEDLLKQVDSILGHGWWNVLSPVEIWAAEAIEELKALKPKQQDAWRALLLHCQQAKSAKPSKKWSTKAEEFISAIDGDEFCERVSRWFTRFDAARGSKTLASSWDNVDNSQRSHDLNGNVLRGLLWLCPPLIDDGLLRAIRDLALSAYRKIRGLGPRAVKVGNAAVAALGEVGTVEAVGQLAILKVRVKFGTAQKGIEKSLVKTAEKAGVPRIELEEMAVPSYGLTEIGKRIEQLGEHRCELVIINNKVELHWFKPDGKQIKSVPKAVKDGFAEELKELKTAQKDIQRMMPAQAARIEDAYRLEKSWPFETWRERYLDHPLVGAVARRLIWNFGDTPGVAPDGELVSVGGKKLKTDGEVSLWHPLSVEPAGVLAWREYFENSQVRQPFKQAHREIYRLTDAERTTNTYSNRFAAHIVKQHQFNSLVAARGWKHQLRLMVDDEFTPAYLNLPHWNMRAEFWVEGVGDEYGTDTTESGAYLYLATDQVRFYRLDAAQHFAHAGGGGYGTHGRDVPENHPLQLEEIPPLALSEVLRDVDLFVGVASVANDPTWSDGGPEGRYLDYWGSRAFGDLSATAQTRKDVLGRLIPRLKIADRCNFEDRWLLVRGDVRSYRIHLGSGNILMEPNDQYLCIVAKQSVNSAAGKVFLPFEGDNMMSVILSKAFMLADDKKIKDRSILSQIKQ